VLVMVTKDHEVGRVFQRAYPGFDFRCVGSMKEAERLVDKGACGVYVL
jgi:hypothetical protein